MTQGIYINGKRPASKKSVMRAVADGYAASVNLEATSLFGNEYDGPVSEAPDGLYFFVGPDPERRRNFYGQVIVRDGRVTVK